MITAEIELIPFPADTTLLEEGVAYLAIDAEGKPHIAHWNGEELILDNGELYAEGADPGHEPEHEEVDIVMIGIVPGIDLPETI